MKNRLLLLYILILTLILSGCGAASSSGNSSDLGYETEEEEDTTVTLPSPIDNIPTPDSYEREKVRFSDVEYVRPDTQALLDMITSLKDAMSSSEITYEDQLAMLYDIDGQYMSYTTMKTYLNIMTSHDSTSEYYRAEYDAVSGAQASLSDAIDDLCVAAAQSEHCDEFERDYFGAGFLEKYKDGEKISTRAAELLAAETALENEYRALSPSTVEIYYAGVTETYESAIARIENKYRVDSFEKMRALAECERRYSEKRTELAKSIFIELVRTRRLIADEMGYDSYTELAYDTIYHDYTPEDMERFTKNVKDYIVPVYASLADKVFYNYFTKKSAPTLNTDELIANLSALYAGTDREIAGIFGFMQHYGLFDVAISDANRDGGAFTTYFDKYDAPFIFMSADGTIRDYAVLAHEFGHFADSFINFDSSASIDLHEISSQGLELLTLGSLEGVIPDHQYQYLLYSEMENALLLMIYQSFYSSFEHYIYALEYDEISEESLNAAVSRAASDLSLASGYYNDISFMMIDHIVLYPHYVQSYSVSIVPSLEIYFLEEETGHGYGAYTSLITRDSKGDFIYQLKSAGLSDPFDGEHLKSIADKIHFSILGCHYYTEFSGEKEKPNAA